MKVLVVYGGDSPERDVSLDTGRAVAEALRSARHAIQLLDPWANPADPAANDPPRSGRSALKSLIGAVELFAPDVVFIALHGGDGEDGTVQAALELMDVPYTGSGVASSALAMDKVLSKELFVRRSIPTPEWIVAASTTAAGDAGDRLADPEVGTRVAALGYPVVTKPVSGGSTVGTSIVRDESALPAALSDAWRWDDRALVERYIPGRELTVAIVDGEAFPVVEIVPKGDFYDYEAKYTSGRSDYSVPAELGEAVRDRVSRAALDAYAVLRCAGVARVDFRLSPEDVPYCLEVNVVPGMTATSLVPKAAGAAGVGFAELVERLCVSGLRTRRR